MDLGSISKNEKPMLDRTEIEAEVPFTGAVPSRFELRKKIASKMSVKESLVVVRSVTARHGHSHAKVSAYVYKDEESMNKIERKYMLERGQPKAGAKEQKAEPKEAKAEPKEAKSEDKEQKTSEKKEEAPKQEAA